MKQINRSCRWRCNRFSAPVFTVIQDDGERLISMRRRFFGFLNTLKKFIGIRPHVKIYLNVKWSREDFNEDFILALKESRETLEQFPRRNTALEQN